MRDNPVWRFLQRRRQWLVVSALSAILLAALYAGSATTGYLREVFLAAASVVGALLGGVLLVPLLSQRYRPDIELPFAFRPCFELSEVIECLLVEGERNDLGHRITYIPRGDKQIDEILSHSTLGTRRNVLHTFLNVLHKVVGRDKSRGHKAKYNVLIVGNECAGKTRELVELAKRQVRDNVSALIYEPGNGTISHHGDIKVRERALVIVDDLHDRCDQFPGFLDDLSRFVQTRLRRKDVRIVVTSSNHPDALEVIEWPRHKFWQQFDIVRLGFLTESQLDQLIDLLSEATGVQLTQEERGYLSKHRTGTFKLIISLFELARENECFSKEDWDWYEKGLAAHWRRFQENLESKTRQSKYVLRSIDVLDRLGLPLYRDMVTQLAIEWGGSANRIKKLMPALAEYAFPRGCPDGTFTVFEGQVMTGYDPDRIDIDEVLALARVVASWLDTLGVELTFATIQQIESQFCPPAQQPQLSEICLDEVERRGSSLNTLNTLFFRARVEYYLDIAGDALEKYGQLVVAAMDRPEVLLEAARVRFTLAGKAARLAYERAREDAEEQYLHAEEDYLSLIEAVTDTQRSGLWEIFGSDYVDEDGQPQKNKEEEIARAKRALNEARQRLKDLDAKFFYRMELQDALGLALRAQRLGTDSPELRQLIAEIQEELGE